MVRQLNHRQFNTGLRLRVAVLLGAGLVAGAWALAVLPLPAAMAAAGSATAVIVLLRWPWLIWPLLALSLPVASGLRLGRVSVTELILVFAVFLWLADGARRRELRIVTGPVLALVLIYAAVQLISLLRATALDDGLAEVVKWLEFALVIALLPVMVPRRHVLWMAAAIVAAGVAQALLGLVQFAFQIGPEWFVLFDRFMRASGSFRQPNPYAGYLGAVLPLAASLAIWTCAAVTRKWGRVTAMGWACFFSASTLAIGMGLLASWSRGGWIAATVALVVVVATRSRAGVMFTVAGAMAAGAAALLGLFTATVGPNALTERLQGATDLLHPGELLVQPVTDENFALLERIAHWVAGIRMWESAPWFGIGAGNYAVVYDSVNDPVWPESLGHAHNLFLNILAETGLIGLAAFGVMWLGMAMWAWRSRAGITGRDCSGWCHAMTAAALGSMAYLTVHSMVDVLFVQGIYLVLGLILATLAAGCSDSSVEQAIEHRVRA